MSTSASRATWNALIRTHHITSRKKVTKLKQAADAQDIFVLLRSGGAPGIMYVEGAQSGVEGWVGVVQKLRYKDYQLVSRPAEVKREGGLDGEAGQKGVLGLFETESVKDFGLQMQGRRVHAWWRRAMGYAGQDERL